MIFQHKHYFTELFPWTNPKHTHVTIADGNSIVPIQGIGTIKFRIYNKYPVEFHNVLYVPSLSSNLFSVKEFLRYKGTFILAENSSMIMAFPSFVTEATISDELTLHTQPTTTQPLFSTFDAPLHSTTSVNFISLHYLQKFLPNVYHIQTKKLQQPISKPILPPKIHKSSQPPQTFPPNPTDASKHSDTTIIINSSPPTDYNHTDAPTIHVLNSPPTDIPSPQVNPNTPPDSDPRIPPPPNQNTSLPSWIHHDSKLTLKLEHQSSFLKGILLNNSNDAYLFHVGRTQKTGTNQPITQHQLLTLFNNGHILRGHTHLIRTLTPLSSSPNASHSDIHTHRPTLPTEHKPISSWPSTTSFTCDQLRKAFGFRNFDPIIPQIQSTSQNNFLYFYQR